MEKYIFMIEQWGIWARADVIKNLPARSSMLIVMDLVRSNKKSSASITDDNALKVDRAVAKLGLFDETMKDIVFLYFVYDFSLQGIANYLNISRDLASKQLCMANGFLIGTLMASDQTVV